MSISVFPIISTYSTVFRLWDFCQLGAYVWVVLSVGLLSGGTFVRTPSDADSHVSVNAKMSMCLDNIRSERVLTEGT